MKLRPKKLLLVLGISIAIYLAIVVALGFLLEGVVERRVKERLAEAFRADEVEVLDVSVSLLRGEIILQGIKAERSPSRLIGSARIELRELRLALPGWGLALVDNHPRSAHVEGAALYFSVAGLGTMKPSDTEPMEIEWLEISDSKITLVATDLFPSAGRAELRIAHARAESVILSSATSWISAMKSLQASVELPDDSQIHVDYQQQKLRLAGGLFGADPVELPFQIPLRDPRALEWQQLVNVAKELAIQLAPIVAKRKLKETWKEMVESLP